MQDVNEFYDDTDNKGTYRKEKYFTVMVELKKAGAVKQTDRMMFDMLEKRNGAKRKLRAYYKRLSEAEEAKKTLKVELS